eukprot:scaffold22014_cov77-Skeletonema_marinoi.AAC.3
MNMMSLGADEINLGRSRHISCSATARCVGGDGSNEDGDWANYNILKDDSSSQSQPKVKVHFMWFSFESNANEELPMKSIKAAMAADLKGETTRSRSIVIDVDSSLPKSYNKSTATNGGDEASKKHATEPQPQPPILVWMRDGAD